MKVLTDAFSGAENALVSFVTTGKVDFTSLTTTIEADIVKLLEQQALKGLISALGGGIGGGGSASSTIAPLANLFGLPGFATGGAFTVGGSGGTDSQVIAMRTTPGERVTVQTPDQQLAASQIPAAMDSRGGQRVLDNHINSTTQRIRGRITRR